MISYNTDEIFRRPLEENKDINDQSILMYAIESRVERIEELKILLEKQIQQLKEYEIALYKGSDEKCSE